MKRTRLFLIQVLLMLTAPGRDRTVVGEEYANLGIFAIPFEIYLKYNEEMTSTTTYPGIASTTSSSFTSTGTGSTGTSTNSTSTDTSSTSATSSRSSTKVTLAITTVNSSTAYVTGESPSVSAGSNEYEKATKCRPSESVHRELVNIFSNTTGYLGVGQPKEKAAKTSHGLTYEYSVFYDKTSLNNESQLYSNSQFIQTLRNLIDSATSVLQTVFGCQVDSPTTEASMSRSIDKLNDDFANERWVCANAKCSGCLQNHNTHLVECVSKCAEYERVNNCTDDSPFGGIYLKGTCALDRMGNPYCNCGRTVGDVMDNFFDGKRCVNASFIVAMATCAGGFFFLLLLLTLCICGAKIHSLKKNQSAAGSQYPTLYNGYSDGYMGLDAGHGTPAKAEMAMNNKAFDDSRETDDGFKSVRL